MDTKNKKSYLAPQLTAVSFKSEHGFAASGINTLSIWASASGADEVERLDERTGWEFGSGNSFWGN